VTIPFPLTLFGTTGYPHWNQKDKTSGIGLSNAAAMATAVSNGTLGEAIRGTVFRDSGKRYFEVTLGWTGAPAGAGFGIATRAAILASATSGVAIVQFVGGAARDLQAFGAAMALNNFLVNAVNSYVNHTIGFNPGTPRSFSGGNVCAVAVDLTSQLIWFKNLTTGSNWNYNLNGNPATGFQGVTIAALGGVAMTPVIAAVKDIVDPLGTLNVGLTAFTGTIPSGFTAWGT
jgi:hypothetical protein